MRIIHKFLNVYVFDYTAIAVTGLIGFTTPVRWLLLLVSHPVFYGDLVYKLRRVKDTPNFILSGSIIVKRLRRRQYNPGIIERTIGIVLGPSTALYEPFLKHCTLTNKAVGTI